MQPNKAEVCQIRMTVGGDKLNTYQDVRSSTIGITDKQITLIAPSLMYIAELTTALVVFP